MITNIYMIEAHDGRRYIGRTNRALPLRMAEHRYQSKSRNPEMHALLLSKNFEAKIMCQVPSEHGAEFEELVLQIEKPVLNKVHTSCAFDDRTVQEKRIETMNKNGSFGRAHINYTPIQKTAARVRAIAALKAINTNPKYSEARRKAVMVGDSEYASLTEASKATGLTLSALSEAANGIRLLPSQETCYFLRGATI